VTTSPAGHDSEWIRRYVSCEGSDLRLICFPHAGGSASYYYWLSKTLAPNIEVLALQYPGRQDRRREKCIDNIAEMADSVLKEIQEVNYPYAFFGHSMGAIIAFEVALRLQAVSKEQPVRLFLSGRRGPSCMRSERIHLRDDAGLLQDVVRLGGTDPRILEDDELIASMLSTIRSDYKAAETYSYTPGARLDCPITAIVGDNDPQATTAEAATWAEYSTADFDLRTFPGGHFYLTEHKEAVASLIAATLALRR
jgi:surfactin synthase thioesterase subunit